MNNLVLNPISDKKIAAYISSPSHALIIIGPTGSGIFKVAKSIAENIVGTNDIESYPYKHIVSTENNSIGIDVIREIDQFLSLKVPGNNEIKRFVIIENAHLMTIEAQNSLLKNLEEPPSDTVFILTVTHTKALLPTILSRAQAISVGVPSKEQLKSKHSDINNETFTKLFNMSGGKPDILEALINDSEHPLNEAVEYARRILSSNRYERMLLVNELQPNPELINSILDTLVNMSQISLEASTLDSYKKWGDVLRASYVAKDALQKNAQPKLVLMNLMLSL
ncbi:MAG: hypothetical protein ACHQT9_03260 [Candidatus Saccharimonadales bacterium]